MKKLKLSLLVVCASFVLSACHHDDDDDTTATGTSTSAQASVRIVHAVPDAPPVNVQLDGVTALSNLNYSTSSGFTNITAGSYDINVEAIVPDGTVSVIQANDVNFAATTRTTLFAVGTADTTDTTQLAALPVAEASAEPAPDEVALRVLHAAPAAGNVDIYITAPGAGLSGATPIDAGYLDSAELSAAVPAGTYQVRITEDGNSTNVIYDSGSVDLSAFAGSKLIIAAINTTNQAETATSAVKLLAVNDTTQLEIPDVDTQAGAKVVHLSPDAGTAVGSVEVFANNAVELIPTFDYGDVVAAANSYALVSEGTYDFDVSPDNDSNSDVPASSFSLTGANLGAGSETTVLAIGYITTTPGFRLITSADENRAYATHARLKVIHGAAAVGDVNVYVAATGSYTANDIESGNGPAALLSNFGFASDSGYVDVNAGSYDVFVQDVASGTVVIAAQNVAVNNGDVISAVAFGPDGDGTPANAGLLLLTN